MGTDDPRLPYYIYKTDKSEGGHINLEMKKSRRLPMEVLPIPHGTT